MPDKVVEVQVLNWLHLLAGGTPIHRVRTIGFRWAVIQFYLRT